MSPASERSLRIWLPLPEIWTRTLGAGCTSARPRGSSTFSVTSKSVVTGCCSWTATYSISARNSAAPLIGQFRVISWRRLARIEQAPDDGLVDRPVPLGRADHLLHDDAVAVDQEALRHAGQLVGAPDRPSRIVQDVEREAHLVHERHDLAGSLLGGGVERVAVDAHGHNAKIRARQLLVQPLHRRHLDAAGRAPGRPDVDEDHVAAVVGE